MEFKEMGSVYVSGQQNLRQVHQVQNLFYACSSKKCAKMHMLHVQSCCSLLLIKPTSSLKFCVFGLFYNYSYGLMGISFIL